jgi:hypothetical protein
MAWWAFRGGLFGAVACPLLMCLVGGGWFTLDMVVIGGPVLGMTVGSAVGALGGLADWVTNRRP